MSGGEGGAPPATARSQIGSLPVARERRARPASARHFAGAPPRGALAARPGSTDAAPASAAAGRSARAACSCWKTRPPAAASGQTLSCRWAASRACARMAWQPCARACTRPRARPAATRAPPSYGLTSPLRCPPAAGAAAAPQFVYLSAFAGSYFLYSQYVFSLMPSDLAPIHHM